MKHDDKVLDYPILIPHSPNARPRLCCRWTFHSLSQVLKDTQLSCRVWRKCSEQVLETACDHLNVTMKDFNDWLASAAGDSNPLKDYGRSSHAAYIDYKYMKHVFCHCPENLANVQWADFGLPDFDGEDSTIWIGSEGANTPGHQDSYGFNLVTQIVGRKMWVLFPPSDVESLYPTRVPYEESSIFSQVHIGYPNIDEHPAVKSSHPLVVILHPGQTLYIPRHWWHYVESLDPSISINVWVPHKDDSSSHLTESLTRCLATHLLPQLGSESNKSPLYKDLLNPTETLCSQSENLNFLKCAVERVIGQPVPKVENGRLEKGLEKIESINEKDGNAGEYSADHDHLNDFGCWLKDCSILQAPMNPCLNFCRKHFESDVEGCISQRTEFLFDSNRLMFRSNPGKLLKKELHDCTAETEASAQDECDEGNYLSGEKILISRRRKKDLEQFNSPPKRLKDSHNTTINANENCLCDRKKSQVECSSSCSSKDVVTVVYSLAKAFPYHQFLHLMKVKKKASVVDSEKLDFTNNTDVRHSERESVISLSEHSVQPTQSKCTKSNSDDLECSERHGEINHDGLMPPSSQGSLLTPTACGRESSSSSGILPSNTTSLHDHSDSSVPLSCNAMIEADSKQPSVITTRQSDNCLSDFEQKHNSHRQDFRDTTTNNTEHIHSAILSSPEKDVHRLLFESVLHPSVIEKIASIFKAKYENLLKD